MYLPQILTAEHPTASTVFAMFGRFFILVALNSGQQLMMEVFPTELRAQGTAVTTSMGQVASLASPYFAHSVGLHH